MCVISPDFRLTQPGPEWLRRLVGPCCRKVNKPRRLKARMEQSKRACDVLRKSLVGCILFYATLKFETKGRQIFYELKEKTSPL